MIQLRVMLPDGEQKFRDYINQVKNKPGIPRPDLNTPPYSEEFPRRVEVDELRAFSSKKELAEYLDGVFTQAGLGRGDVIEEKGLWTWLAYLWFEQLTNGYQNILKREEYYIATTPQNFRRFYLHLVAAPYILFSSLKGKSDVQIFLYNPIWQSNDFTERVAPNQFLISHPNIIEAIHFLYFDYSNNRPKIGATSQKKKGNVRRFIKVIQQFELTYDIYSMTPQQIISLLPDEFKKWKPRRTGNSIR